MKIALIDVDGHNFPNLPLMKLSAYHKSMSDSVEWYHPLFSENIDRIYMSKIFTFTPDYSDGLYAKEIIKGGTGYFYPHGGNPLSGYIEHLMPDYSLYEIHDTAYGFLTRGCPRGCGFCIVKDKEGAQSKKVADLSEFWRGQENIVLLDPNLSACEDAEELLEQLACSGAWVDITQGMDIRLMSEKTAQMVKRIKIKQIHFAWDRYVDRVEIVGKLRLFKAITGWSYQKMTVYALCGYDTTIEQDLERIETIRYLGYNPYVMIYEKEKLPQGHKLLKIQRWVNNRIIFRSCKNFLEYNRKMG